MRRWVLLGGGRSATAGAGGSSHLIHTTEDSSRRDEDVASCVAAAGGVVVAIWMIRHTWASWTHQGVEHTCRRGCGSAVLALLPRQVGGAPCLTLQRWSTLPVPDLFGPVLPWCWTPCLDCCGLCLLLCGICPPLWTVCGGLLLWNSPAAENLL